VAAERGVGAELPELLRRAVEPAGEHERRSALPIRVRSVELAPHRDVGGGDRDVLAGELEERHGRVERGEVIAVARRDARVRQVVTEEEVRLPVVLGCPQVGLARRDRMALRQRVISCRAGAIACGRPLVEPSAVVTRLHAGRGRERLAEVGRPRQRADEGSLELRVHVGVFEQRHAPPTFFESRGSEVSHVVR
jgi:hypothetical protein